MPIFNKTNEYDEFEKSIIHNTFNHKDKIFIEKIIQYSNSKIFNLKTNTKVYRAQIGCDNSQYYINEEDSYDSVTAYSEQRMIPNAKFVKEGRINSKNIAYFYCSDCKDTAMAEVRPWLNNYISLGTFYTNYNLRLVDFRYNSNISRAIIPSLNSIINNDYDNYFRISDDKIDDYIWNKISYSFSEPVSRNDDEKGYLVTQFLAKEMKDSKFDGIIYKSLLHKGYNICLFDLNSVKMSNSVLYSTEKIKYSFDEVPLNMPV